MQHKLAVFIHNLRIVVFGGCELCACGICQVSGINGTINRDIFLLGGKACFGCSFGLGREYKVPEVNVPWVVIAHTNRCYFRQVKAILRIQLVQVQLYGYPLIIFQRYRAVCSTIQARCAQAAFLLSVIVQQFQIQVAKRQFALAAFRLCVNIERQVSHLADIYRIFQCQYAVPFTSTPAGWIGILVFRVPVQCFCTTQLCGQFKNISRAIFGCWFTARIVAVIQLNQVHIRINGSVMFRLAIVRCLVLDVECKQIRSIEAALEPIIDLCCINDFLNLQLVIIREVERHRHVGLPHTAFHIVHGKGVLLAFVECKSSALRGERNLLAIICYVLDRTSILVTI